MDGRVVIIMLVGIYMSKVSKITFEQCLDRCCRLGYVQKIGWKVLAGLCVSVLVVAVFNLEKLIQRQSWSSIW